VRGQLNAPSRFTPGDFPVHTENRLDGPQWRSELLEKRIICNPSGSRTTVPWTQTRSPITVLAQLCRLPTESNTSIYISVNVGMILVHSGVV